MTGRLDRSTLGPYRSTFYLATGLLLLATILRSFMVGNTIPARETTLVLLGAWVVVLIAGSAPAGRRPWGFAVYLAVQTTIVAILLSRPGSTDFYGVLFGVLSMQAMGYYGLGQGLLWVILFVPVTAVPLALTQRASDAVTLTVIYTAVDAIMGWFALTSRRAGEASARRRALALTLRETNIQVADQAARLEGLAVARERQRVARELHDSVTQTIFSMTLATQSTLMLLDREPDRVGGQLDRLAQLTHSALAEMQVLMAALTPGGAVSRDLASRLEEHVAERTPPEGLSITVVKEGEARLPVMEEHGLFRIIQEALNNVVKHAGASQAEIRLHLADPPWVEVRDDGAGFVPQEGVDRRRDGSGKHE